MTTTVGLLIISNSKNDLLFNMLLETVDTAINSVLLANNIKLHIFCAEKENLSVLQLEKLRSRNVLIVPQNEQFNYNGELNKLARIADQYQKNDYFILANSDLQFIDNCIPEMIFRMKKDDLDSASPYDPLVHGIEHQILPHGTIAKGYKVRYHISGWCIFLKAEVLKSINYLNESVSFWYSDDIYAEQLIKANKSHGLVTSAVCIHLGSTTLKQEKEEEIRKRITIGEHDNFLKSKQEINAPASCINENLSINLIKTKNVIQFFKLLNLLFFKKYSDQLLSKVTNQVLMNLSFSQLVRLVYASKTILQKEYYMLFWENIKNKIPYEKRIYARFLNIYLKIVK